MINNETDYTLDDLQSKLDRMPVTTITALANICYLADLKMKTLPAEWTNANIETLMHNAKDFVLSFYGRHPGVPAPWLDDTQRWNIKETVDDYVVEPKIVKGKINKTKKTCRANDVANALDIDYLKEPLKIDDVDDFSGSYLTFQDIVILKQIKATLAFFPTIDRRRVEHDYRDIIQKIFCYIDRLLKSQKPPHQLVRANTIHLYDDLVELGVSLVELNETVLSDETIRTSNLFSTMTISCEIAMQLYSVISRFAVNQLNKFERRRKKQDILRLDGPLTYN